MAGLGAFLYLAASDVGARKLPFLALDISGLHSNFKIISNKVRIKIIDG